MAKTGRPPFDDVLTPAEWRVTECVRHGLTNPQIAERLEVSLDAVKYHVTNALQKLGLESRKALRQWDGIRKSSALFGRTRPVDANITIQALGQVARTVREIRAAETWYRDVLGMKHLYTFGGLAFFDCDGVRLFLSESDAVASESILYFRVPDIHAAHSALIGRGVEFINAPHRVHKHEDGTEEWMAFFNDNEGRPLALMAQVSHEKAT